MRRCHSLKTVLSSLLIAAILLFASLPQAHADTIVVRNRYPCPTPFYFYNSGGYARWANATDVFGNSYLEFAVAGSPTKCQFGFLLYRINQVNQTDEFYGWGLTQITPSQVGIVERTAQGSGYQNTTWVSTEVNLNRTDGLVIEFYTRRYTISWGAWIVLTDINSGAIDFQTEPLTTDRLDSTTWNITYYTEWTKPALTNYYRIYYGDSTYQTRIENIQTTQTTPTTTEEIETYYLLGATLTFFILLPIGIIYKRKHEAKRRD